MVMYQIMFKSSTFNSIYIYLYLYTHNQPADSVGHVHLFFSIISYGLNMEGSFFLVDSVLNAMQTVNRNGFLLDNHKPPANQNSC